MTNREVVIKKLVEQICDDEFLNEHICTLNDDPCAGNCPMEQMCIKYTTEEITRDEYMKAFKEWLDKEAKDETIRKE